MDDPHYLRYLRWRSETVRQCRSAVLPPVVERLPAKIDVAAIRERLGEAFCGRPVSQRDFARRYGFGRDAVRDWELGRRQPNPAARVLLLLIDHDPDAVEAALQAAACRDQSEQPAAAAVPSAVS